MGTLANAMEMADHIRQGMEYYNTFDEARNAHALLHPDDAEFDPDYAPTGSPSLPSQCLDEDNAECLQCYAHAQGELNFLRHTLERLRSIYGSTKKYSEKMIAFGDSMAGLPGGFGIGWPPERAGIQKSVKDLGKTYDKKYRELIANLEKALREIADCEQQFFDTADWYDRYGFIYYTFMADRYRRAD